MLTRKGLIEAKETVRRGRRPERTIYEPTEAALSLIAVLPVDDDLSVRAVWRRMHELRDEERSPEDIQKIIAAEFAEQLTWMNEPD